MTLISGFFSPSCSLSHIEADEVTHGKWQVEKLNEMNEVNGPPTFR